MDFLKLYSCTQKLYKRKPFTGVVLAHFMYKCETCLYKCKLLNIDAVN